jgi:hypothetical protein
VAARPNGKQPRRRQCAAIMENAVIRVHASDLEFRLG